MEINQEIYNEFSPTPEVKEASVNERFVKSLVDNQKNMPDEMAKYVDEHFWELI